jgi:hypothetical protein
VQSANAGGHNICSPAAQIFETAKALLFERTYNDALVATFRKEHLPGSIQKSTVFFSEFQHSRKPMIQ